MTTPIDLKKCYEIVDAATSGPWEAYISKDARSHDIYVKGICVATVPNKNGYLRPEEIKDKENAKFIAHFNPQFVRQLLEAYEESDKQFWAAADRASLLKQENNHLQTQLAQVKLELSEAEEMAKFYADETLFDRIDDLDDAEEWPDKRLFGKRARAYLAKRLSE